MSRISSFLHFSLSSVFIRVHRWLLLAFIFCISCGAPQEGMQTQNLIIATATPGGTYYPVGVALSTTITQKLQPKIVVAAINSAGSAENIQMLVNREAHLAILLGLYGAMAYRGERVLMRGKRLEISGLLPCYGRMSSILYFGRLMPKQVLLRT